jgi:hypothetical protein
MGVFFLRYGDDLCYPVAPGVQGDATLGALVDLAAPPVGISSVSDDDDCRARDDCGVSG